MSNIERQEPIAIVRPPDLGDAPALSSALVSGGIRSLEFTMTNRKALAAIKDILGPLPQGKLVPTGGINLERRHLRTGWTVC